ncbi:GNAT family N-acetyltransferase [Pelistega sp. NLN82]|uniref:GNAT family N-acetyltransferase n=1 Tax=Pelistega ratti TaxID=2652177 RepID=A0A6L9Y6F5_9BURK|nr:GNAT family N-acetyltransferase [Pelistega ratti]NEN75866.1 GNAT family N-acetyltransferase [Pelistega ratti]
MIHIRKIDTQDVEQLQQIAKQTFIETFAHSNSEADMQHYLSTQFSIAQLKNELNNPDMAFYFAEIAQHIVGYLKLNMKEAQTEPLSPHAVELQRIYILNQWHGQGVGQQLFDFAIQFAKEKQADYLWLGVWEHNHKALRFYQKNGLIPFDRHIFQLGNDAQTDIMMKLTL